MRKKLLLLILLISVSASHAQFTTVSGWTATKLTPNNTFNNPWEITYGPDGNLWISDRSNEKIVRISTSGGTVTDMINISGVTSSKQGGLLGMAIHPALYTDITTTVNNYVFSAYTYDDGGGLQLRIARLIYNNATGTLSIDTSLGSNGAIIEGLPASSDHNSGRLIFGPDEKLYYTIGEQGANQFENRCNAVLSQVLPTSPTDYANYPGKTLRLNIDGSIPSDNPTLNSVQSHVFAYGQRNTQGIVFAQDGTLYASEHGPKTDDEINIMEAGKNYGWPEIAGYYDNNYTYCNWSTSSNCGTTTFTDHNCPVGAVTATEFESYPSGAPANFSPPIGTYGSSGAAGTGGDWGDWPTIAPSSIDIHETGNIPGWGRSLLIPTLKKGTIYRAKLTPAGNAIEGDTDPTTTDGYELFHSSHNRYRDIAISPDGLTIYAITDSSGSTSGPSTENPSSVDDPGVIVKIEYVGPANTDAPTVICQGITVTLDPSGNATILASEIDNGSSSNIVDTSLTLSLDRNTFNCNDTDTPQTVVLTVTDAEFNKSSCSASVTVLPNSNPDPIVAPTLEDIISNCSVTVEAPTLITNGCIEVTATTTDPITYSAGESGTITWLFDDGTSTDTTIQNVTVNTLNTPTNLAISNVEALSASSSWDSFLGATYEVRIKKTSDPATAWLVSSSDINSFDFTNLEESTEYEVQTRALCGSSTSAYTTSEVFTTTSIAYCIPTINGGYYGGDYWISNVTLKDNIGATLLSNTSDDSDDVNGYSDHTDDGLPIPSLVVSETFDIEVTLHNTHAWNKTTGHSVWIDYNQDGDFNDSGERVWGTTDGDDLFPHGAVAQGSFVVPTTVTNGNTRMRFHTRTYWTNTDPCDMNFTDGNNKAEYEDYIVNISGGGSNTAPVATNDIISGDQNITINTNVITDNNGNGLDSDIDGDILSITQFHLVSDALTYSAGSTAHLLEGTLTINTSGDLTFIPANNYSGSLQSIVYTLFDGTDDSQTATIDITINSTIVDADGDGVNSDTDCDDNEALAYPGNTEVLYDGIDNDCNPATPDTVDADGDGVNSDTDCDDNEALAYPGNTEVLYDGIDNDCNPATPDTVDADGDGVNSDTDCDDNEALAYPGNTEVLYDGIDNDCNPATPDTVDADGDGVNSDTDCDDNEALAYPGNTEVLYDGIDNDCNPATPDTVDADGDGVNSDTDCDDNEALAYPGNTEVLYDGIDNDCNPATPDTVDADGDGVNSDTDCDDNEALAYPGNTEVLYDGIDNDCNPATPDTVDADGDGVNSDTDCDDNEALAYPGNTEVLYDGIDNDCNPATPDTVDADGDGVNSDTDCDDTDANEFPNQTWYLDADGDGYSDGTSTTACNRPANYYIASELTAISGDCDDNNNAINSGVTEISGNGIDDDCNPSTPDGILDIEDSVIWNVNIYPNPISNEVTVKLPSSYTYSKIILTLFDLRGRVVKQMISVNSQNTITLKDLSRLDQGTYFIKVNEGNKTLVYKKLIKK
ncbi:PQQ-dependent sugar dehydrogenase [Flaviramulus sp. BrNp1-15]|uniref:PQQ-dependent sugar dehydrogenase n=1 Tax=Flaviramulus sp. BrNp1-15 TaxID=2916754 RepID=UPI001EE89FA1|nr:PQQ-dependent sugar dehydrogenase [Flaviramulus sp. BrNp1-15]ULC59608.1 PQQ-dependent sugar dehydrogenase [Flaviramulus sp. BrNp1-15]